MSLEKFLRCSLLPFECYIFTLSSFYASAHPPPPVQSLHSHLPVLYAPRHFASAIKALCQNALSWPLDSRTQSLITPQHLQLPLENGSFPNEFPNEFSDHIFHFPWSAIFLFTYFPKSLSKDLPDHFGSCQILLIIARLFWLLISMSPSSDCTCKQ